MNCPAYQGSPWPGISKMTRQVMIHFWWPSIRNDIEAFVGTCPDCQCNKASSQKKAGLLHPPPVPDQPWDSVSMDPIVQLPPTLARPGQTEGYDAILVCVNNRLTNMVKVIPTFTTVTAECTAKLCIANVSNRGSVFTGTFWSTLLQMQNTRRNTTTAFHPQADGQTERVNRVLEHMLRHYMVTTIHT
jgi:hypothetical protein